MAMDKEVFGLVLNAIDYKDKDKLLNILTPDMGAIFCAIKGVKGEKAKNKAFAQPFVFAKFGIITKSDHNTITSCEMVEDFFDITKDITKLYCASSVIEIVSKYTNIIKEPNSSIFLETLNVLRCICYSNTNPKLALIKFLQNIIQLAGYQMNFDKCLGCKMRFMDSGYLDLNTGSLYCKSCAPTDCIKLLPATTMTLKNLMGYSYDKLSNFKVSDNILNNVLVVYQKLFVSLIQLDIKTLLQII